MAGYNLTYNQWSEENNFVFDQRGFSTFVEGEAAEFLDLDLEGGGGGDDPRLLLDTVVTDIAYGPDGVVVSLGDGDCIEAQFAICTFSVGVLQNEVVAFDPPLPRWKREAVEQFQMGTYTKIFMQFGNGSRNGTESGGEQQQQQQQQQQPFWDQETQFFLYADNTTRGYYPIFQSLTAPGFLEGSNILFVTVVDDQAYRVERQSDEVTKAEIMEVLRTSKQNKETAPPLPSPPFTGVSRGLRVFFADGSPSFIRHGLGLPGSRQVIERGDK